MSEEKIEYNSAEREVIGLCVALEAVGNLVNHALFDPRDVSTCFGEVEAVFHTYIHLELFLIRLLDFVKETGDCKLTGVDGSCLKVLKSVCNSCSFNQDNSIESLKNSVQELDA